MFTVKKSLSFILILSIFLSFIPFREIVYATDNHFTYAFSGGEATITGYTGPGGDVVIPSSLGGYPVINIGNSSFANNSSITGMVIPDSIIRIGSDAFYLCTSLTSIIIPDSVISIGDKAFWACTSLISAVIGNSVINIGDYAFYHCTSLTSITVPDSVTNIGNTAFAACMNLESVVLSSNLTTIGQSLFSMCYKLEEIILPDSVETIYGAAFSGTAIKSIYVPKSVKTLGGYYGSLWVYFGGAFDGCEYLDEIIVDSENENYKSFDGIVFSKDGDSLIQYPAGKKQLYYNIPDGTKDIHDGAFKACNNLTNVGIPDSVISIGMQSFNDCKNLTDIIIPYGVTSIGTNAFRDCTSLNSAYFKGNVPTSFSFGVDVFRNTHEDFKIYYIEGATGFTTPTWRGYPTEIYKYKNLDPFDYDSNFYNSKLAMDSALFSMLAYTDYYRSPLRVDEKSKRTRPTELMWELENRGYDDILTFNYKDNDMHNVSFVLARKQILHYGEERTLVSVIICGTDGVEWLGNMDITGTSYNEEIKTHYSFYMALNYVRVELLDFIQPGENALLLVTGHSRGGGVANLVANAFTDADFNGRVDKVFGYTFAAPNVTKTPDKTKTNIFNFCFYDDFVASVPLSKWGYDKHGISFYISADELYRNNKNEFKSDMKRFTMDSDSRLPDFNAKKTSDLIDYVSSRWPDTSNYYNDKYWLSFFRQRSLYQLFRDTIAPIAAKMWHLGDIVTTVDAWIDTPFSPVVNFFLNGKLLNDYINDTHQAFTYFSALWRGGFDDEINKHYGQGPIIASFDFSLMSSGTQSPDIPNTIERDQLIAFAQTGDNLGKLGWDLQDISTWTGITWNLDEENRVIGIDIKFKDLVGNLNLSGFEKLQTLDCSGNEIESIDLAGCVELKELSVSYNHLETLNVQDLSNIVTLDCKYNFINTLNIKGCDALEILDCSYNEIINLEISSHLQLTELYCNGNSLRVLNISENLSLTSLDCTWNYLDVQPSSLLMSQIETMLERQGSIARYAQQNIPEQAQFNTHDISKLELLANQGDNLGKLDWDLSAPITWSGIEWLQRGNEFFAHRISISGLGLEGTLDLADMEYLSYLSNVGNSFSSVDVSGCASLQFLDCRYSDVENLDIVGCLELMILYCEYNFLTPDSDQALMSTIQGILSKEGSIVQYLNQNINAVKEEFNQMEYTILSDFANTQDNLQNLGWDMETPGQWQHVTWNYENGEYRVSKLDLSYVTISGEIDLTGFDMLSEIDFKLSRIQGVILPGHITEIKDGMFYDCVDLEFILMPDNIISIGKNAFYNCRNLGQGLSILRLPDSVTTIGETAFYNCLNIAKLQIGDSLNRIDNSAFLGNANLSSVTFTGNAPDDFGMWIFDNTHTDFTIYYSDGNAGFVSPTWQGYSTKAIYNVIFKDWNGDIIDSQNVVLGEAGFEPEAPLREGYIFVGWDVPFDNITQETIITAQYRQQIGGILVIAGIFKYGEELTVDITGITPIESFVSYQWNRNGVEITGATNSIYITSLEDIGQKITVTVTGIGDNIGSITSDAITPTKADEPQAPATPTLLSKAATSIVLETNEGYEYSLGSGEWQSAGEFTGLSPDTTYTFYSRIAETATHEASLSSDGFEVTTDNYLLGDINNDGRITTVDALMALQAASGRITLTDQQKLAADVNKDGRVTTVDALMILQYASGRITSFGS